MATKNAYWWSTPRRRGRARGSARSDPAGVARSGPTRVTAGAAVGGSAIGRLSRGSPTGPAGRLPLASGPARIVRAGSSRGSEGRPRMRIWIDMTAPAHVLVFRPVIERLRAGGHDVAVTARDYAQTLDLLELHKVDHVTFGRHGGASRARKLASLVTRTNFMRRFGSRGRFDLAIAH